MKNLLKTQLLKTIKTKNVRLNQNQSKWFQPRIHQHIKGGAPLDPPLIKLQSFSVTSKKQACK